MTALCTHNFACTNVYAKSYYKHKNQCSQILNLLSPVSSITNSINGLMGDQILNPKNIAVKRLQEENEKLHDKCKRLEKRVVFF